MKNTKNQMKEDITEKQVNKLRNKLYKAYLKSINSFRDNSIKQKLSLDLYYQVQEVFFRVSEELYWNKIRNK